jgi:type VI secretion system VgrG family protein
MNRSDSERIADSANFAADERQATPKVPRPAPSAAPGLTEAEASSQSGFKRQSAPAAAPPPVWKSAPSAPPLKSAPPAPSLRTSQSAHAKTVVASEQVKKPSPATHAAKELPSTKAQRPVPSRGRGSRIHSSSATLEVVSRRPVGPNPLAQATRPMAIATPLGEDVLALRSMHGREELGRLPQFDVELLSQDYEIPFNKIIGENVTLRLNQTNGVRYWNGYVSHFTQLAPSGSYACYRATIVPWLWFLTRTQDCQIFQNKTVPEIIELVFKKYGFDAYIPRLTGHYFPREYCVQYRETAFNFLSRLMEQEGIYYYFEHENGKHTLMLVDSLSAHRPMPGYEAIKFRPPDETSKSGEDIRDWTINGELLTGRYAHTDYNFLTPRASLEARIGLERDHRASNYEVFDYPGAYQKHDEGDRYVHIRIEEIQCRHDIQSGEGHARGLCTGHTFKLADFKRRDQNREYLLVSTTHNLQSDFFESTAGGQAAPVYRCSFNVVPSDVQYRAESITQKSLVKGPQTAMVVGPKGKEVYIDDHARVKVQFHWDRYGKSDENSSCWVRAAQPWAGGSYGGVAIPRIGHEVIVDFLEGDPDRPVVNGRLYNGKSRSGVSKAGKHLKVKKPPAQVSDQVAIPPGGAAAAGRISGAQYKALPMAPPAGGDSSNPAKYSDKVWRQPSHAEGTPSQASPILPENPSGGHSTSDSVTMGSRSEGSPLFGAAPGTPITRPGLMPTPAGKSPGGFSESAEESSLAEALQRPRQGGPQQMAPDRAAALLQELEGSVPAAPADQPPPPLTSFSQALGYESLKQAFAGDSAVASGEAAPGGAPRPDMLQTSFRSDSVGAGGDSASKTGGHNEITMSDTAGQESLYVKAQFDKMVEVGNNRSTQVGVDSAELIGNNRTTEVGANSAEKIGSNLVLEVGANAQETVGASKVIDVGTTLMIKAGTSITLKCGASMIHMNQAGIITISGTIITVAGAVTCSMAAPITNVVGGVFMSTNSGLLNMVNSGVLAIVAAGVNAGMYAGAAANVVGVATASVGAPKIDVAGANTGIAGAAETSITGGTVKIN